MAPFCLAVLDLGCTCWRVLGTCEKGWGATLDSLDGHSEVYTLQAAFLVSGRLVSQPRLGVRLMYAPEICFIEPSTKYHSLLLI